MDHAASASPSGASVSLRSGSYAAEVASVGASLRSLTVDRRDLVVPFRSDEVRPLFRGAVLAPWPNRVVDGRYDFAGESYQLALNEPERSHALHGLVMWNDFDVVEHEDAFAVLETDLVAQSGYPFPLRIRVVYRLGHEGLTTEVSATNTGSTAAPFGTAAHPYLVAGPGRVDDWTLEFHAGEVLEVDADRLIPRGTARVPVAFDFASPRRIGDTFLDHAFTDLSWDAAGEARLRLTAPDGTGVESVWDRGAPWVQVHTGDRPEPELDRLGLAVEPMTCPPDAFNSRTDLVVLEPGETHGVRWRIAAIGA